MRAKIGITLLGLSLVACSEDNAATAKITDAAGQLIEKRKERARKNNAPKPASIVPQEPASDRPTGRAAVVLTRDSFAQGARDPFERQSESPQKTVVADLPRKRQREVRFSGYNFEDLRLIAIVRSGKNIPPRALFVGSDGVSKSIQQGEYFSRSEVLLASVNSDYVEIEIVDEELAQGLNMEQGERRAIYLKQD